MRIEELYPFPDEDIIRVFDDKSPKEVVWLQEEPRNNGPYLFVRDKLASLGVNVRYIGRRESSSPATGFNKVHKAEQARILAAAFAPYEKNASEVHA